MLNEEFAKTALNGIGKRLNDMKKNIVQADWKQNDPTAPDYIKNRVGGYGNGGEAMVQSGDTMITLDESKSVCARKIGSDTQHLHDALVNKDFTYAFTDDADDEIKNFFLALPWVITDDYAYLNTGDGMTPIFALFTEASLPLEGFDKVHEPGIYISVFIDNDYKPRGIKGISWGEIVKIPQKYLPDPEPKDTLVVKFSPTSELSVEADHTRIEILNAYASGRCFIKGLVSLNDHISIDCTFELNTDMLFLVFKFQSNGISYYILMYEDDNTGYVVADSMLHFESDNYFTLKVTTPGWDGKIYAWGQEWDGSQLKSVYFDGKYRLYLYGIGNGKLTGLGDNHEFILNGSDIHAKGSIEMLRDIYGDTSMVGYCYSAMFSDCTSLVEAPELPATTLPSYCYYGMFGGCTSLVEAPELPATTLASYCYYSMFYNCTSLVEAPELPATTLASDCYYRMFYGCTSLVEAPELPATTLASVCYYNMFSNCTSLVEAPELPATTLASACYYNMFYGCTSLVEAPELPATALASACYSGMFYGCVSLKFSTTKTDDYAIEYRIPSDGTASAQSNALSNMFTGTGGTFTGTPTINTTYYLHKSCRIVGMTDDPKPVPKTDEMTQPVGIDKWTGELFTKPGGGGGASIDLGITGATVGQIVKISAVDSDGKPTAWEPVDIPASGGEEWELIDEVALSKDTLIYNLVDFAVYRKAWIIMTRPSNVSATTSITRVSFARKSAPLEKWFSADILNNEFTKLHFDIQAEVTSLFAIADRRRYEGNDYGMPMYSRGLKLLGDVSPDELILFMKFANGDMMQEGDKLTILGVKR